MTVFEDELLDALRDGDMTLAEWEFSIKMLIAKYGAEIRMKTDSGRNTTSFRIILPE
jgi:hypothetical protein